jgi:large subunit ribosomal protein L19e
MKTLRLQRKLAARILRVGENIIWLDPDRMDDIREAITSEDIRDLIKDKAIKKKIARGVKARAGKLRKKRKKKGRKRGAGKKRKNIKKRKKIYVENIRKMRNHLKSLKKLKKINSKQYNKLKRLSKAGYLTSIRAIDEYLSG